MSEHDDTDRAYDVVEDLRAELAQAKADLKQARDDAKAILYVSALRTNACGWITTGMTPEEAVRQYNEAYNKAVADGVYERNKL